LRVTAVVHFHQLSRFSQLIFAEIIAPHLIWHAGRTAESVRTMAMAALYALVQGAPEDESRKVVESLMVPLGSLIDDQSIATRSYALRIVYYVGPLKYEQLKTLAPAMLSRLDDPGNEVREKAAKCLGRLELAKDDEDSEEFWEALLKQVIATMLIHVESPEINLREGLIESLRKLSSKYRKVYQTALDEATITKDLKEKLP
jgi:dynein assembly factor 5, axonemal